MKLKNTPFLFFSLVLTISFLRAQAQNNETAGNQTNEESDQQISGFSLAGYGEKGKKAWDVSGKSADILTDVVKLNDVTGNLYGEKENVKLTADNGDFNKSNGKVHLEKNVVVTTTSGVKLTTDSMDWDRTDQTVTTPDRVNIEKDNIIAVAQGAKGRPNLKKVALEKDVHLNINPTDKGPSPVKEKIVITCDGPAEVDYDKNIAVFNNNVKVEKTDTTIYSDRMDIYFVANKTKDKTKKETQGTDSLLSSNKIDKIVASGNVKIERGENVSYSEEAIYTAADRKIVLNGRPKLVIYSTGDLKSNAPFRN